VERVFLELRLNTIVATACDRRLLLAQQIGEKCLCALRPTHIHPDRAKVGLKDDRELKEAATLAFAIHHRGNGTQSVRSGVEAIAVANRRLERC
jgi:hypothetical protein